MLLQVTPVVLMQVTDNGNGFFLFFFYQLGREIHLPQPNLGVFPLNSVL